MADFRFAGTTPAGRSIQGNIKAASFSEAKEKTRRIAERHRLKIQGITKRRTFVYKAKSTSSADIIVRGEQRAFSKDEVVQALHKLGYETISVQAKLLEFTLKPPPTDIITFVRVSADLIREGLPFNEVLQLLINDTEHPTLKAAVKEINNDLRQGKDSEEAFTRQSKIFGAFTAKMLGLAAKSGNMASIYDSTAKFLERNVEFKRSLKSALIMPFFTILVLIGACAYYVGYIFPETARLFLRLGTELPPMTAATLQFSDWMVGNIYFIIILFAAICGGLYAYFRSPKGIYLLHRLIIRLPMLGSLIHKSYIEIFCRVFYALYSGSGENVDAIKTAAEACGNRYMEHRIKSIAIPMMLKEGKGIVKSLEATGVFTPTALARFNSGAETGTIKQTALQIANYYEKETVYKLKNAVEFIQLAIAMVIMIVITALTLLSAETAMIKPRTPLG